MANTAEPSDRGTGNSLDDAFLAVYQQALVEKRKSVVLGADSFPVRSTANKKLKQVDFRFQGSDFRGVEQNPETKSRWAKLAREGKAVMQFLAAGRYLAVVADGRLHRYPAKR